MGKKILSMLVGTVMVGSIALPAYVSAAEVPTCFGRRATLVGTNRDPLKSVELNGTKGNDVIVGLRGADTINGRGGDDLICSGGGSDYIKAGAGNDKVKGGKVADTIYGGRGRDRLWGDEHSDSLDGGPGNDRLFGGRGFEDLMGGLGDDLMDGGVDYDRAQFWNSSEGIEANLDAGTATGQGQDQLVSVEGLVGSHHDDVLTGNDFSNDLQGGEGDDVIYGLGSEADGGFDILRTAGGSNLLDGGDGPDFASYNLAPWPVDADLSAGTVTYDLGSDTLVGIENLFGSRESDTLVGNDEDNVIVGNWGDDVLDGKGGMDEIGFMDSWEPVTANLATGTSDGGERSGVDTFVNFENLSGSVWADLLTGNDEDNLIWGGSHNDTLVGLGGNDVLRGGRGTDDADGGDGIDECEAETHNCEFTVLSRIGTLGLPFAGSSAWRRGL